jgi:hypothetical protein
LFSFSVLFLCPFLSFSFLFSLSSFLFFSFSILSLFYICTGYYSSKAILNWWILMTFGVRSWTITWTTTSAKTLYIDQIETGLNRICNLEIYYSCIVQYITFYLTHFWKSCFFFVIHYLQSIAMVCWKSTEITL